MNIFPYNFLLNICLFNLADPEAFDEGVKVNRRGEGLKTITLDTPSGKVDVQWGKQLFEQKNTEYHNDIALVSAALSDAAETEDGNQIVQSYKDLGFEEDNIFLYSYPGNPRNRSQYNFANDNTLAFSIAHCKFGDEVLLTFCLRGTKTLGDIIKDLKVGNGKNFFDVVAHSGFYDFYEDVIRGFVDYWETHPEVAKADKEKKLKILVTGHSLGGAGANLVGAYFNNKVKDAKDKDKIFVYTFAAPNVYTVWIENGGGGGGVWSLPGDRSIYKNYEADDPLYDTPLHTMHPNIFNIMNKKDFVPYMPPASEEVKGSITPEEQEILWREWRKFGEILQFSFDDAPSGRVNLKTFDIFSAMNQHHIMKHYLRAVQTPGALRNVRYIESNDIIAAVHCPVDVEVVKKDGTVVARVRNDEIDENVTEIMTIVDGDKKYFWFDDSVEYTLRVVGNDTGTMDMAVIREKMSTPEKRGVSIFKNVEIVKGKTMEGTVSKDSAPTEAPVKLYALDKNGVPMKEIQSDGKEVENLFAEKVIADPNYSWTVTFNGALDASTVNAENFFIQDEDGNLLSGIQPTVVDGTKVRFVNNTTFEKNKVYYLVVKKEVRGQGNTKLKKTVILKFRVE